MICAVFAGACSQNEETQRAKLRAKLDAEFKEKTTEVLAECDRLKALVKIMSEKHDELDEKHRALNTAVSGRRLYPEDRETQKRHEEWEVEHERLMGSARDLIDRFEARKKYLDEAEVYHDTVPVDQLVDEHAKFARDLEQYMHDFQPVIEALEKAERQMTVIFREHEEMMMKYSR